MPAMNENAETPLIPSPPQTERAFRLVVEYDGTRYCGWQRQENAPSVQQTLEDTLARITRHPLVIPGAGRTDTGVHAAGQVACLRTTAMDINERSILRGGNTLLPPDIRIVSVESCDPAFDPRRDARWRRYRYTILNRPAPPALDRHRVTHLALPLDWAAIEAGLAHLPGRHDFSAFRSAHCQATRTELTMLVARHVADPPLHHFDFLCRSFLHNMVRLMSGLLIEIGLGMHAPEVVADCLRERRRTVQFRTAAPTGLVLLEVGYEEFSDFSSPVCHSC